MAKEAFGLANAKLFLRFQPVRKKRRTVIRIAGGVVTLGAAPPPVTLYDGPTSRKKVKKGTLGPPMRSQRVVGDVRPQNPNLRIPVGREVR